MTNERTFKTPILMKSNNNTLRTLKALAFTLFTLCAVSLGAQAQVASGNAIAENQDQIVNPGKPVIKYNNAASELEPVGVNEYTGTKDGARVISQPTQSKNRRYMAFSGSVNKKANTNVTDTGTKARNIIAPGVQTNQSFGNGADIVTIGDPGDVTPLPGDVRTRKNKMIDFYPNPTSSKVNISNEFSNGADYRLMNRLGQVVLAGKLGVASNSIDLSGQPAGSYYLQITGHQTATVILQ